MSKTLELTAEGIIARLEIRHATVGDAMQRGILAARASNTEYASEAERAVALMIYPRCVACTDGTIEKDGEVKDVRKMTAAEFIALPYEIGEAWLAAILEENPGWSLQAENDETAQKKRLEVVRQLEHFYCTENSGDFPDETFGLGEVPAVLLEPALELLVLLEAVDWKWDINTLLEQPADLLKAVLRLKVIGEKLRKSKTEQA